MRRASHAGSWYERDARKLGAQLDAWLDAAAAERGVRAAIICPHAGYSYSGSTAAFSYGSVDVSNVRRVWVLGPSHHVDISGHIGVSRCAQLEVPLGAPLRVDVGENAALLALPHFTPFEVDDDEAEHSLEMQFPYIWKVFARAGKTPEDFVVVPLVVGSLDERREREFGAVIAERALADPRALVVVSSDFCHWGSRFRYQYLGEDRALPIYKSIEVLDRQGMDIITRMGHAEFVRYLKHTRNTICGRHPIGVMLAALDARAALLGHGASDVFKVGFLAYKQSSQVHSMSDSSVSYAAASVTFDEPPWRGESPMEDTRE